MNGIDVLASLRSSGSAVPFGFVTSEGSDEMHAAGEPMPPALRVRALGLGRREDLTISIAGYGTGRWSVILA